MMTRQLRPHDLMVNPDLVRFMHRDGLNLLTDRYGIVDLAEVAFEEGYVPRSPGLYTVYRKRPFVWLRRPKSTGAAAITAWRLHTQDVSGPAVTWTAFSVGGPTWGRSLFGRVAGTGEVVMASAKVVEALLKRGFTFTVSSADLGDGGTFLFWRDGSARPAGIIRGRIPDGPATVAVMRAIAGGAA